MALFSYPKQAAFERVLPKNKIYAHANPSRRVRELFVAEVAQIVWKYKLSPETVNLPAGAGVPEIQVFGVELRVEELSETILRTIDKAIPFPIIFELTSGERTKSAAAYKRPNEADPEKWVVDTYFDTAWQPAESAREPLPVAVNLAGLYEQLLRHHIALPPRPAESLRAHVERAGLIRAKENECRKLEARLQQEQQFNRKVELNQELRSLRNEVSGLRG